jgi:uncharacterized protein
MKLHLIRSDDLYLVQSVTAERIVINNLVYTSSMIITPQTILTDWRPRRFEDLSADDFLPLVDLKPEVALLGTGKQLQFPAPHVTTPLIHHAMGLEVMDTPAACRTFNILASEGRKVAAALVFEAANDPAPRAEG